jgi:hypothetical protein
LNDFATILGAIASAAALVAVAAQVWSWIQQGRRRRRLDEHLHRLWRLDRRLVALISEVEARLTNGVGWYGFSIWPPALRGHLIYLAGLLDELERTTAELRSLDADGPVERLRHDLERLTVVMHEAGELYERGIIDRYRRSNGAAVGVSPAGREPTPALEEEQVDRVERLRREAQLLFRTAYHQLHRENVAERYRTEWPTLHRAFRQPTDPDLWGSEVRPMERSEDDIRAEQQASE